MAAIAPLLDDARRGNDKALAALMPLVYDELRRLAHIYMQRERPGHTLQTTALVHEAYVRLAGQESLSWQNRAHFRAIAAETMRRILVDHARRRSYLKRGGGARPITLPEIAASPNGGPDILALDGPKRVSMTMLRDLSAAQLIDALELGIRDNHTEAELAGLRERIDALAAVMKEIGGAKEKMVITLDFLPGTGTLVMLDGVPRGKPIPGEDFYRALLRIWIGEKPVDSDLKEAMLGGKN